MGGYTYTAVYSCKLRGDEDSAYQLHANCFINRTYLQTIDNIKANYKITFDSETDNVGQHISFV